MPPVRSFSECASAWNVIRLKKIFLKYNSQVYRVWLAFVWTFHTEVIYVEMKRNIRAYLEQSDLYAYDLQICNKRPRAKNKFHFLKTGVRARYRFYKIN